MVGGYWLVCMPEEVELVRKTLAGRANLNMAEKVSTARAGGWLAPKLVPPSVLST